MKKYFEHSVLCILSTCIIICAPGCNHRSRIIKKKIIVDFTHRNEQKKLDLPPPITVWIHGTRFLPWPIYSHVFKDKPGLIRAANLSTQYNLRITADMISNGAPAIFPLETFYLFGWSGKLDANEREEAAQVLYNQLAVIATEYKKQYNVAPVIRIITHSHGGNVALNMAREKNKDLDFSVAELILLACPVQAKTVEFIRDPMFKKIYALYSSLDWVQVLAPQIVYKMSPDKKGNMRPELKIPPLSDRRFPLQNNVVQTKIKINGRALFHGEFVSSRFLSVLKDILDAIVTWDLPEVVNSTKKNTHLLCINTKGRINYTSCRA